MLLLAWPAVAQAQGECQQSWTFSPTMHTLRNNVDVGGIGHASVPFYSCVNNADVYVIGQDGITWFKYLGNGAWTLTGADPGGTHFTGALPPPIPLTECDHEWTIGAAQGPGTTLRDGLAAGGGVGTEYRCLGGDVYVLSTDFYWWKWDGTTWLRQTTTTPAYGAALNETVSMAWYQANTAEVTGWTMAIAGQPHVDVPLSAMAADQNVKTPFDTRLAGEFTVTMISMGCVNRDSATKTCVEFGGHSALPVSVRVSGGAAPLPDPLPPTGARVQ